MWQSTPIAFGSIFGTGIQYGNWCLFWPKHDKMIGFSINKETMAIYILTPKGIARCINGRMLWPWAAMAIRAVPDSARNEAQSAFSASLCVILQSHMTWMIHRYVPSHGAKSNYPSCFFLVPKGIQGSDSHETWFERRASPETARPCSEVRWSEFSKRWTNKKKDALQKVDFVQP